MSHWLDVRIKLYSTSEHLESICTHFREYFHKFSRKDPNIAINLGSETAKFIWCTVKGFESYNSIVGYTRTGFDETNAAEICEWISSKFPAIDDIHIQTRDDGSKIFAIYRWAKNTPTVLNCRKIDPMRYPDMHGELKDSYSEIASKRISAALKNSGITNAINLVRTVKA